MKKLFTLFAIVLFTGSLSAKKVKFAVDMATFTISPNGIHVMGDFQAVAGYTADWSPGATLLTQEGTSTIYSIIVDIPAFQKYEFKFVDGDQSYEAEFVPDEARVGYSFNDNRWIYVDSLANDTTFMGAVQFSGNSPAGKALIRYKVDMTNAGPISANGVHVGTSYQTSPFDPTKIRLYSFENNVYEIINYVNTGNYSFKYYNGNTLASSENVPSSCSSSGNRTTALPKDSVLPTVCFSGCAACVVGVKENNSVESLFRMYPNPAGDLITISSSNGVVAQIFDNNGKLLRTEKELASKSGMLDVSALEKGIYFVRVFNTNGKSQTQKLIKE
jgi:hypothetical protein